MQDGKKSKIYESLNCNKKELKILQYLTQRFVNGDGNDLVIEILEKVFKNNRLINLKKLTIIKSLLNEGWIVIHGFGFEEKNSKLEILYASVGLSSIFLELLEKGEIQINLPENKPYKNHLEYLKDQFSRIELYEELHNNLLNNANAKRFQNKIKILEDRIENRVRISEKKNIIEQKFDKYKLTKKEQIIFLTLLKEEYSDENENIRELDLLVSLVSFDEFDKIKNRSLLNENSKLISNELVDYEENLNIYGGIVQTFFINEEILHKIMHPNQQKRKKKKIKLDMLVKEQDIFELIKPKTSMKDVVLDEKTKELIDHILKQMDGRVLKRLQSWGIKNKKNGIDAKLLFYGVAGTGKTMSAYSLAKSLNKGVLSFDCSKILSQYVGESEKNVRNIFDTYKHLKSQSKSEPILLLNEADQFLSQRTTANSSIDKMHNQMQNIFLEQIEEFEGIIIATTNLLESLDKAFSRRFDFKIEFKKPKIEQREKLWQKMLPKNAEYQKDFDIKELTQYNLTGGQIKLIIKNTALKVAIKEKAIFTQNDFKKVIENEIKGSFGEDNIMGFM